MPFDGSGFDRWPAPEPAKRPSAQENVLTVLAAIFMILMFVLPVSAGTLVMIVRYLAG